MTARFTWTLAAAAMILSGCRTLAPDRPSTFSHFIGCEDFSSFSHTTNPAGQAVWWSPELRAPGGWNQLIVSWNAPAPAGTFLQVEARALWPRHASRFYLLGKWTPDNGAFARTSVPGQADRDGAVATDTLMLPRPATAVQVRLTFGGPGSSRPRLKFLGLSLCNTRAPHSPRPPNQGAWGVVLPVPEISQRAYPGQPGWCSPTAVAMVLNWWAGRLGRPDLARTVPEVASAVYDSDYNGTGNWPFNTAYAGAFPGLRGYVTRLDGLTGLEDWIAAGIPVVISARWNLLQAGRPDTGHGHLLVCTGFTRDGQVIFNDPAGPVKTGRPAGAVRVVYRRADVRRAWAASQNTVYLICPAGAKTPADPLGEWWDGPP